MKTIDPAPHISAIYLNGDDGYLWLYCENCDLRLTCLEAGDTMQELIDKAYSHECADENDAP